ncbi:MAG: ATP-dependent zinc metalloprotease FtsH [Anaerolineae bacterium]
METEQVPRLNWIWLVALLALIVFGFYLVWPRGPLQADISYSEFLRQVRSGNVATVHIVNDQITGTFVEAQPASVLPATRAALGAITYTAFHTTFPTALGDPTLLPTLEEQAVEVTVAAQSGSWLLALITYALPVLLLIGAFIWMGRRAAPAQKGMLDFVRSRARRYGGDRSQVTFEDVAGADEAKQELQQVVDFLRRPRKYHDIGARIPLGVLLVGPPGTGKTLMGRAVAGEAGVPFFHISASEFVEMFVGVGAGRVRDLFRTAKENAPSIVFVDELDAVGRRRGTGIGNVNDEREQTLNQLLVEMDGFESRHNVIIMAATNRPDVLDPALLRPGRFDRQVVVGLPDRKGREAILAVHTRSIRLAPDVDLGVLARATTGMSGADLANLTNEAALVAATKDQKEVTGAAFLEALDKVQLGEVRSLLLSEKEKRIVAYHECGHALVAWLQPEADPVQKVTIIPRGRTLGVTHQLPEEDKYNLSRQYLLTKLAVTLGGRTAEQVVIGDITTGAENDLVEATRLARRMVTRWGMGELGPVSLDTDTDEPFLGYEMAQGRIYSEDTAARVDREVQAVLTEREDFARTLLTRERAKLDAIVEVLLRDETIDAAGIASLLGPHGATAGAPKPATVGATVG